MVRNTRNSSARVLGEISDPSNRQNTEERPRKKLRRGSHISISNCKSLAYYEAYYFDIKAETSDKDNSPSDEGNAIPELKCSPSADTPFKKLPAETDPIYKHLALIRKAKDAFCLSTTPMEVTGREEQKEKISAFLASRIDDTSSGSLYIAGAPGTGKTLLTDTLLDQYKNESSVTIVRLNAMACGSQPKNIYRLIMDAVSPKSSSQDGVEDVKQELESMMVNSKKKSKMIVLFLDEIDWLVSKDQEILYRIFEWPFLKNSRCILIGIANALDLTERILPRLQTKNIVPELISFPAYTPDELCKILEDRVKSITENPDVLFQKNALNVCAKKVASYGDSRKAIDVVRIALDKIEYETKGLKRKLLTLTDDSTPTKKPASNTTSTMSGNLDLPKVTMLKMIDVLDSVFGGGNPMVQKIMSLTPHQKSLIAVISAMRKQGLEMSSSSIYDHYIKVCRTTKLLTEFGMSTFKDLLVACETSGIIETMKATSKIGSAKKSNPYKSSPNPSVRRVSTPGSHKKSPAGALVDRNSILILSATDADVEAGIKDIPYLVEIVNAKI